MSRRKVYLIEKKFQFKLMLRILFIVLLVVGFTTANILVTGYYFFNKHYPEKIDEYFKVFKTYALNKFKLNLFILIIINILVILGLSLLISHQIAGPVYRIKKELKEIGEGDLTKKLKLRKNDDLQDLVEVINDMVRTLQKRLDLLASNVDKLEQEMQNKNHEELSKHIQEIREILKKFNF